MDYLRSLTAAPPGGGDGAGGGGGFNLQPLWFLYYLLIFYVLTIGLSRS